MKTTYRPLKAKVQNHKVKSSGHSARSALLDRGTGTIDLRQLSFNPGGATHLFGNA